MGHLERLNRYFNENGSDHLNHYELSNKLDAIKRDIRAEWEDYKRSREIMSDAVIKDNALEMVLLYFIKKGFFDADSL